MGLGKGLALSKWLATIQHIDEWWPQLLTQKWVLASDIAQYTGCPYNMAQNDIANII